MVLLLLAYLGGVLTILSPCILPVLPFVFARADRPFARNGLPMLDGKPVRFRVTLDGKPPGADHGSDTGADGNGVVTSQRLYQLVRQADGTGDRVFEITFLEPGVRVYSFTFG
jgi:hypothetical protein